ncbi:ATP-binding cassette domain-containing protein [Aurantimicrobium minutum]|uniref:ATP-binding cassette domain-containing protein n=1 Tax=Aurantimicrobium minutum TaxID=708131 RepID=UPI0024077068|nr:ATP-binding cassette domain-containing protein [Aurantimicrobium minutum]
MSLTFAAVFILLRIAYRLVFGSFSWQAIGQAATLALPFAAVIVVCGFLSALVDVRKLLPSMSALRYGRSIGTALAIALSSYPTLIHQVKQLGTARRLRGVRSRLAFLVPLLEHTIERAVALAAAMDLKGFGAGKPVSPSKNAAINFDSFTLSYDGKHVLGDITLSIPTGEITVLTGLTGSGKTAVLESIAGLSQHFHNGHVDGTLSVGDIDRNLTPPRHTAGLIGYVAQNVRLGFAAATAQEELEFGMRVSGHSLTDARIRADELIREFSLTDIANQPIELLSAGEATRVAIAASLAVRPRILLLDEPLADLDAASRTSLVTLLATLHNNEQLTIVMAEHHTADLDVLLPRWLCVDSGEVREGQWSPGIVPSPARSLPVLGNDQIFRVNNMSLSYGDRELLNNISLSLHVGEILAITGANGVGKSSLLNELVRSSSADDIVRLVPEDVSSLFISETLGEELSRADAVAGHKNSGLSALTFWSILAAPESSELLEVHPRDLSAGTQLALAIAVQLAWKPRVILVDEPTRGLDESARSAMAEVLRCVAETGTAVIFASHDRHFVSELGCRELSLHNGALVSVEVRA